jgi:ABC-type branched-subunit amino acid transport system ATPase component
MLSVEDIHVYYGESHVLQGMSLALNEGEIVCLLGRNGAGKTTTLRGIVGFAPPRRGRVRFDGMDIAGRPVHENVRRGIGYVPEDRRIFPGLTVTENLEVAALPPGRIERRGPGSGFSRSSPCWRSCAEDGAAVSAAANSKCWPWPGPWPAIPGFCCSTSPAKAWRR